MNSSQPGILADLPRLARYLCWLRCDDRGELVHRTNRIAGTLANAFRLDQAIDPPESAHEKRTAQESFDPEAFLWRRSMPWADPANSGLVFVAFGKSFDAFEVQMKRMVGAEDGIPDALFRFTRPVTGSYFWCPPMKDGRLDLSAIGM